MGWRGRREAGRGMHVNPWLIHVNVWQKPLQCCKVISLQLIKINGKKKEKKRNYGTHYTASKKMHYNHVFQTFMVMLHHRK